MLVALHRRVNDKLTSGCESVLESPLRYEVLNGWHELWSIPGPTVIEGSVITIFAESVRWARFAMHRPRSRSVRF